MANQYNYIPPKFVDSFANFPLDLGLNVAIGSTFLDPALTEAAASVNFPPIGLPRFSDVVTIQMTTLQKPRMITSPVQPGEDTPQYYRLGDVQVGS